MSGPPCFSCCPHNSTPDQVEKNGYINFPYCFAPFVTNWSSRIVTGAWLTIIHSSFCMDPHNTFLLPLCFKSIPFGTKIVIWLNLTSFWPFLLLSFTSQFSLRQSIRLFDINMPSKHHPWYLSNGNVCNDALNASPIQNITIAF